MEDALLGSEGRDYGEYIEEECRDYGGCIADK